jgi:3'-5' exoribonuclease
VIASIGSEPIQELLRSIFGDEAFREGFTRAPAAKAWHHSYIGGLAEHVRDMAVMARSAAEIYPEVDRDLLLAGVLLHDIGKVEELTVTNHISYSDRGRLVGHIVLGIEMLDRRLAEIDGFPEEIALRLKHMILSHHGSLEHGSPVLPMTIEGMLLHYLDNLDAQVRGALMALDRGGGEPGWTEYIKLLDRFLYRGGPGSPGGGEIDG